VEGAYVATTGLDRFLRVFKYETNEVV
jgi:hypothetical protein